MKKRKYPDVIYSFLHLYLGCPFHSHMSKDKRLKKGIPFPFKPSCHVYRISNYSVTMRCRNCKLKFTVTWRNLRQFLENLSKERPDEKFDHDRLIKWIDMYFSYASEKNSKWIYDNPKKVIS